VRCGKSGMVSEVWGYHLEKGNCQYVCIFPGHAATMRGVLMVK
jgi:azurin